MSKATSLALLALAACAVAEPPSGYSYSAPLVLHGSSGGGYEGGISLGGGGGGLHGGGPYHAVPHGYQTSEGQYVDPHLLEEIKQILLKDEIHNQQYRASSGGHGGLSSVYGAPSSAYGVPHYHERVVGIELGHVKQGIQVAQYEQGGYGGGYASGGGYAGGYSSGSSGFDGGHGGISSLGLIGSIGGGHGSSGLSFSSGGSGHSSLGYTTIAVPAGSYGVPIPSGRYGSPHH